MNDRLAPLPFADPFLKTRLQKNSEGALFSHEGTYSFRDGIYDFISHQGLSDKIINSQLFHDNRAQEYEENLHLTFFTHGLDEDKCRSEFIAKLRLRPGAKVLEIAAGTGRDSKIIDKELIDGEFHITDISREMLKIAQKKVGTDNLVSFSLAEASKLPFVDDYFDAVYSFGGVGEFPEIEVALAEMARVSKRGARVVFGDESIAPWLRGSHFSEILATTNPQFLAEIPIHLIPDLARDLSLEFVINQSFYLISYTVGKGAPTANFDFEIPGLRGGTYRTRYEGQIEGLKAQSKERLYEYCRANQVSVHDFLENLLEREIGGA